MKKRWIDVMLAVAVCLGLSGCSSGETSSMPDLAQGPYTNGSYEVKMPQYEGGWAGIWKNNCVRRIYYSRRVRCPK